MIFDNVRTETMNRGDMKAMLAACQLGRDASSGSLRRYGVDVVMSAAYEWMDYSERMLRAEIAKIPDGEYGADRLARRRCPQPRRAAARRDDGGRRGRRDHDRPDGLEPGGADGLQRPFEGSLLVAAYYAVRTMLLDEATFPERVPQNDGVFRPVKVIAPKGTIFNPNFPRACFSRFCQVQRVVDNTILALADALPEKVTAGNSAGIHFCAYSGFDQELASTGSTSR